MNITLQGEYQYYTVDHTVILKQNTDFKFTKCICIFWIDVSQDSKFFEVSYIYAEYFDMITPDVISTIDFNGRIPAGLYIIHSNKTFAREIISDIKSSASYINY